jgi:nickel-dependent lactate racemase
MADPHGPGLSERVGPDDDVSIVVTDVTRATPDDVLVDLLVADLREAGVERDRIAVVVGLGLHRPMTDDELRTALGEYADLAENHDAEAAEVVGEVEGPDGESLIRYTHGPAMFAREGVRLGGVDGNPFRETLDRTGDRIGLDFCLNVTHGPAGFLGAGDHRDLVLDLTEVCKSNLSVALDDSYDAVVAGVGAP